MDLIRDDQNLMLQAELSQLGQFFKDENSTSRILGIAEDKRADIFADQLLLKAIKVNVISAILVLEKRILDALQTSRIRGTDKRRIGRRLVDNCFPGFAKSTDSSIKSGNDAWNETDLGLKNIPIV